MTETLILVSLVHPVQRNVLERIVGMISKSVLESLVTKTLTSHSGVVLRANLRKSLAELPAAKVALDGGRCDSAMTTRH